MKFKAGDRVKVKEGLMSNKSYNGICFAPEMQEYCGKKYIAKSFVTGNHVWRLEGIERWVFSDEMLELAPFGKSDLKTGMRVRYRDGRERIVLKNDDEMVFTSLDGFYTNEHDYTEGLICTGAIDESLDIMEVLKPKALHKALEQGCELISVWKREENPIEVTIAEIAEMKGVSPERIIIREG